MSCFFKQTLNLLDLIRKPDEFFRHFGNNQISRPASHNAQQMNPWKVVLVAVVFCQVELPRMLESNMRKFQQTICSQKFLQKLL